MPRARSIAQQDLLRRVDIGYYRYRCLRISGWAKNRGLEAVKKLAICVAMLLPLSLLAWAITHYLLLKSGFARIQHGTTQAEIVRSLGEPNSITRCGGWGGKPPVGCVKEFAYLSPIAFTDVWVVSFDANDQAVQKFRARSP
jgi:hypothetical protein